MDLRIDPEELPGGFGSAKVFEDDNCYVTFGGGKCGEEINRNVVCVNFKKLGLYVIGGQTMSDFIRKQEQSEWFNTALFYVFQWIIKNNDTAKVLTSILGAAQENGYQQGSEDTQVKIRMALGL